MEEKGRKKTLLDKAGFTMIELIVAVALLGVVTVPIMSSIVQTARLNYRSRTLQKATDLAQNLMEGIREYTMEEVIEQCLDPDDGNFSIIYSSIIDYSPESYSYIDAGSYSTFQQKLYQATLDDVTIYGVVDESKTYASFDDSTYNFAFCNIKYNKAEFDAIVTFEKYLPEEDSTDTYFVYEVTITIFSATDTGKFSDSAKLTSLSGAVQNK